MISGTLVENRVIVWNIEESRALFGTGYYGKPLGILKPKGTEFDAPLVLDLIEACYLADKGMLRVFHMHGTQVTARVIRSLCRKQYSDFETKYMIFRDLRDKGYVVTPGVKFGCDFAVYEHGPGIDHAPYLVQAYRGSEALSATGVVLAGRLATTVKKQFILAIPRLRQARIDYIGFDWWRA